MFPTLQEIENETVRFVTKAVKRKQRIDWITIAGNGEPTLHPKFPEVIRRLLSVRDKLLPGVPVGILSNSSTCHRPEIRQALARLDGRFMKLDAGYPAQKKMIESLRGMKDIVLQSLFFEGHERNTDPAQIRGWIRRVNRIQPKSVQIYTIDRPTRLEGLRRVSKKTLKNIAGQLDRQTGVPGQVY